VTLRAAADAYEAHAPELAAIATREAGKTLADSIAEVREAVDFLRFYAAQVAGWDAATHLPLGPLLCISPWNFPLAIFTGQVAAALAAGNPVLAKPAEQTPLVAAEAVRLLHAAGVPREVLQLLPGRGETVGAALVADARVQGVLFTGSTEVARLIQCRLAERLDAQGRPLTLVAETGGQNAMLVDSSALAEQAVADVLASAFDSAGQRCSALRVLCLQADAAERVQAMLEGAMRELRVGDPRQLATDVGPVIDDDARTTIERHVEAMRARGRRVVQPARVDEGAATRGCFVAPTLIEIERLDELHREVFGPVLHLLRFERDGLDALLGQVNASGYALTFGVHTRIDETVAQAAAGTRAGNVYVNRNMVGAVVGVQPFGGEGLSGTGPKAGGPLTLLRLLGRRPDDAARRAIDALGSTPEGALRGVAPGALLRPPALPAGGAGAASAGREPLEPPEPPERGEALAALVALEALRRWAASTARAPLAAACARFAAVSPAGRVRRLAGPTGEANLYATQAREAVLCLVADDVAELSAEPSAGSIAEPIAAIGAGKSAARNAARNADPGADPVAESATGQTDRLLQLAAVLAVGGRAVWPASARAQAARLPEAVRERIVLAQDWTQAAVPVDVALVHAPADGLRDAAARLAARPGAIVPTVGAAPGEADLPLERLVVERVLSVNTAAAGGNASLMTIG
jgi:RHH-type transcriptional regulator, proline utilization regulon repressor / proline dehydrogenase / delta 1-pyrroline-5-carboxylate dehydrogenase